MNGIRTSGTHPLQIDELPVPGAGGIVGMTFCPGKSGTSVFGPPWRRDLAADLAAIRAWDAAVVVTLMEAHEFAQLDLLEFPQIMRREPFRWLMLPIRDLHPPEEGFERQWEHVRGRLHAELLAGRKVLLHCRGGLGRTGTVAARILVEFGVAPHEAIRLVRAARPGTIETAGQEEHVLNYRPTPQRRTAAHYAGCLLGGAVGDALGWPVEFDSLADIRARFGADGIAHPESNGDGLFEITDDTQMTLFTAEGLLRAGTRARRDGRGPSLVASGHAACRRWLATQGEGTGEAADGDGWLLSVPGLHQRRAPGSTCLSALRSGKRGTMQAPLNDSKGCGAVMRMAPVGLFLKAPQVCTLLDARQRDDSAFRTGCELGALTHGHPSGYLPAGCLALLVARIIDGDSLETALDKVEKALAACPGHEETLQALRTARALAADPAVIPSPEAVARLGEGWVGEEALAIGVFCALAAGDDFARGVRLAVNHGGDSDSTGAIAGNLLGALLGVEAIPSEWLERLELREVVETVSRQLLAGFEEGGGAENRYPEH